ncbi:MAG TPA: tRNA (adenosine(37)-N6)-threonylcarbamoyltransferase complex dimerization subunit type 1 TsaB [Terriglobales bacterium]
MLICAIDTSGRDGSLAIVEANRDSFRVLHSAPIAGGTYSAQLIPTLRAALAEAGKTKGDIGLFAVASGPGSFTGLRVGLSTVKALAEVLRVPVVATSVLECLAFTTGVEGLALAALDAQRNELFVGEYEIQSGMAPRTVREALVPAADFAQCLKKKDSSKLITYTSDKGVADCVLEAGAKAVIIQRPSAVEFARLGMLMYAAGENSDIEQLDANYIRRSDAEIFSAPKLGIKTGN